MDVRLHAAHAACCAAASLLSCGLVPPRSLHVLKTGRPWCKMAARVRVCVRVCVCVRGEGEGGGCAPPACAPFCSRGWGWAARMVHSKTGWHNTARLPLVPPFCSRGWGWAARMVHNKTCWHNTARLLLVTTFLQPGLVVGCWDGSLCVWSLPQTAAQPMQGLDIQFSVRPDTQPVSVGARVCSRSVGALNRSVLEKECACAWSLAVTWEFDPGHDPSSRSPNKCPLASTPGLPTTCCTGPPTISCAWPASCVRSPTRPHMRHFASVLA